MSKIRVEALATTISIEKRKISSRLQDRLPLFLQALFLPHGPCAKSNYALHPVHSQIRCSCERLPTALRLLCTKTVFDRDLTYSIHETCWRFLLHQRSLNGWHPPCSPFHQSFELYEYSLTQASTKPSKSASYFGVASRNSSQSSVVSIYSSVYLSSLCLHTC
jgi:hypothetical protein